MFEKLGDGSFGVVKRGEWITPAGTVVRRHMLVTFMQMFEETTEMKTRSCLGGLTCFSTFS